MKGKERVAIERVPIVRSCGTGINLLTPTASVRAEHMVQT